MTNLSLHSRKYIHRFGLNLALLLNTNDEMDGVCSMYVDKSNARKVQQEKPKKTEHFGRPSCRQKWCIVMILKETVLDWIN
jgi:hypothetical protein